MELKRELKLPLYYILNSFLKPPYSIQIYNIFAYMKLKNAYSNTYDKLYSCKKSHTNYSSNQASTKI